MWSSCLGALLLLLLAQLSSGQRAYGRWNWGPPQQQPQRTRPNIGPPLSQVVEVECGKLGLGVSQRIIGGHVAVPGEYPWLALLQYRRNGQLSFQCGGVLINKRYVLTAAHCTNRQVIGTRGYTLVSVRLGEYDTRNDPDCDMNANNSVNNGCADPIRDFGVEEVQEHEGFVNLDKNDIALIRLNADIPLPLTNFIRPICLPRQISTRSSEGMNLVAAGWGRFGYGPGENRSPQLRKVVLPILNIESCNKNYNRNFTSSHLCAGGKKGEDTCTGDSGGPLMGADNGQYEVHAIVSVGALSGCGGEGTPAIYTRVTSFLDWIQSKIKP